MMNFIPQFEKLIPYTAEIDEQLGYLAEGVAAIKDDEHYSNSTKNIMGYILSEISVMNTITRNITFMINEAVSTELNNTNCTEIAWEVKREKLVSMLSYIYEQIAEYMSRTDSKIINKDYPIEGCNIGSAVDDFLLYEEFSLDDLITATHYVFNYIYGVETVGNKLCATFAHNGMIFGVLVNTNTGEKDIIKVCRELPGNIRSLDSILKEYTDRYNKDQEEMAICNRLLLTKENKE